MLPKAAPPRASRTLQVSFLDCPSFAVESAVNRATSKVDMRHAGLTGHGGTSNQLAPDTPNTDKKPSTLARPISSVNSTVINHA